MADELNGTDVQVGFDFDEDGSYVVIGGSITHGLTLTTAPIVIDSKEKSNWRTLLPGEGLQTFELSIECVVSTNTIFRQLRNQARLKLPRPTRIIRGGDSIIGRMMVTNFSETYPDSDKGTCTFTLTSDKKLTGLV
jgi:hypothetical protein